MTATARKSLISVLAALLCAIAAAAVCATAPSEAFAEEPEGRALSLVAQDGLTASGGADTDTYKWTISTDGHLTVSPKSGDSGSLGTWELASAVPWHQYRSSITSVSFTGTIHAQACCYMFKDCTNLTTVDLTGLETSGAEHMTSMFEGCSSLTNLTLGSFSTASATDMASMFKGCSSLTSLDLRSFNTENIKEMGQMFSGCSSLTSLDVSSFVTSNVENMGAMFEGCSALQQIIGISGFNTSKAQSLSQMFYGCAALTSLDLSNFDVAQVSSTSSMFSGCSMLESLTLWETNPNNSKNESTKSMFEGCAALSELSNLTSLDTSGAESMASMFKGCSSLTTLDLSSFNTAATESMDSMFEGCSALTALDVSHFQATRTETTAFPTVRKMFLGCSSLVSLELFELNTANRGGPLNSSYYLDSMFEGCSSLETLDLTPFETSRVTHMDSMFKDCSNLKTVFVDDSNWTASISDSKSSDMFLGCMQLVGDAGTTYDPSHITYAYAHIDENGNPGYFTDPTNLKGAVVTISSEEFVYNRDYQKPKTVTVTLRGNVLQEHTDYSLKYSNYKYPGTATITVTGINGRYKGSTQATYEIHPAPVYIKAANNSKTFGESDPSLYDGVTVSGAFQYEPANYTITRKPGENAGTYEISVVPGDNPNYAISTKSAWFTINPKAVTVTANNASKVFGENDPKLTATIEGVVDGCPVNYTLARDAGEALGEYNINVELGSNRNYFVTPAAGTFTITKAPASAIGLTVVGYEGVYDGQAHYATVTAAVGSTFQYSIDGGSTWTNDAPSITNAGELAFKVKAQNPNCDGEQVKDGLLKVTRKSVSVKADDKTTQFGDADPEWSVTVDGAIGDDAVAYTIQPPADERNAGTYAIAVSGAAVQGNYVVEFAPGKLTVGKKAVTVTVNDGSKTFGDADPSFTVAAVEGEIEGHPVSYALTRARGENVGTYAITATSNDPNYDVTAVPGTLTINRRAATVTANDASKPYGDPDPKLTAKVTGEAAGHPVRYTLSRAEGEVPGTYAINVASDDPNYDVAPVGGTFTIAPASIEGAVLVLSKTSFTYDGKVQGPEVTSVGGKQLVAGTDFELVYSNENSKDAGTYTVKVVGKNYCQGESAGATYTIAPKPVKVIAKAASKTYGAADPKLAATVEGLVGSDTIKYTLSRAAGENVGTYAITATGAAGQGNYTVSFGPAATFKITAASIDGSALVLSKSSFAYSGKAQKPKVKTVGGKALVEGRDYTLSYKNNVKAGTAQVVVTGKGNYAGTATKSFKITKAKNSAKAAKTSVRKTVKASKLKKKAQSVVLPKVKTKFGKYVWKPVKKDKKGVLSVKSGKIKVKKGAKKGTYTIKVKASVAGTKNYKAAATKVVTVKVTVR